MAKVRKGKPGGAVTSEANCNICSAPLPVDANYCPQCGHQTTGGHAEISLRSTSQTRSPKPSATPLAANDLRQGEPRFADVVGEHKHATLMFADIRGSLKLIHDFDPEEIETEIDKSLMAMIRSVERFEGSVLQVRGDGILAIFGAPIAQEDHAARACNAALSMLSEFKSVEGAEESEVPQIGIGIHSGEIVISTIETSVGLEYRMLGASTWTASRLENLADPGIAIVSESTRGLTEGLFDFIKIEPVLIKGQPEKVQVYQLAGRTTLTRFEALVAKGLSPLAGRKRILDDLLASRTGKDKNETTTLVIRGHAGVGKSRLAYELIQRLKHKYAVAEAHGVAHARPPFSVFSRMLRLHLQIGQEEHKSAIEEKMAGHLQRYRSLLDYKNALSHLLDLPQDEDWKNLDPGKRQIELFAAVREFLEILGNKKALLLLVEDLQWFDDESIACLRDIQNEGLQCRLLIVGTERFNNYHVSSVAEHGKIFDIGNLTRTNASQLVRSLVGDAPQLQNLVDKLLDKTDCNPFYIEETVRLLVETKTIEGMDGSYALADVNANIDIPPTVESIVASRLDRLPPVLREITTIAAIISSDIDVRIITQIVDLEGTIETYLKQLVEMDILFVELDVPVKIYQFRHALIFEILLKNLHSNRRRSLHISVLNAIERIHGDRLMEMTDQLARHARLGECWEQAVTYYKMDCIKSIRQYANEHATIALERALECLEQTPDSEEKISIGITLRLMGLAAILPLGDHDKIQQRLFEALGLAESIDDSKSLGIIYSQLAAEMWISSEQKKSMDYAKKAYDISLKINSLPLKISAWHGMGAVFYSVGAFEDARAMYAKALAPLVGENSRQRFGWVGFPSVICRTFLGAILTLMGKYKEAMETFELGRLIADEVDCPYSRAILREEYSVCLLETGRADEALEMLELAVQICEQNQVANVYPSVCARLVRTLAATGQTDRGIALAENAQRQKSRFIGGNFVNSLMMTAYAYALMRAGHHDRAVSCIMEVSDYVESKGEYPNLAIAQAVLGEILAGMEDRESLDNSRRAFLKGHEIADRLGMLPTQARCIEGLGRTHFANRDFEAASKALKEASDLYSQLDLGNNHLKVEDLLVRIKQIATA